MEKKKDIGLDFEIGKLTNSIENVLTSEVFDTEVVRLTNKDSRQIRKVDWQFNIGTKNSKMKPNKVIS